jgi:DNA-binding NarL/FixJ family response regulator
MTDSPSPLLLIIEDDLTLARSVRSYFEDYEYTVLEASDGTQGLNLYFEQHPDIVLTDLQLPGMDGIEILSQIHAADPNTPVLVISGSGTIQDVVQAMRQGAWDYLIKPINQISFLRYSVEKALERARLICENNAYRQSLEDQVQLRTAELKQVNAQLENKNIALREILGALEDEKDAIGQNIQNNVEKIVIPLLANIRLRLGDENQQQMDMLERQLLQITAPYNEAMGETASQLSPTELRVAMHIRQGLSVKEIAHIENISADTVATHRRSIRRKLGLTNAKINLMTYLETHLDTPPVT